MLAPSERDLVGRDPALRGMCTALDPEALVATLRAHMPETTLLKATRTYIRYKPGANCLVAHRLSTSQGELSVYAKTYGPGA